MSTAALPPGAGHGRTASRARSFGTVAASYHGARTTYFPPAVDWALAGTGPGPLRVLDLAAGTGLLTAALRARRPAPELQAVEPDAGMRAEYLRHAGGVPIRHGTAEAIPAPDGGAAAGFDAVVVGTAFHWFDQSRALPEIARVLRDGGVLAALWTGPDDEVDWVGAYRRASGDAVSPVSTDPEPAGGVDRDAAAVTAAHADDGHRIGSHPLFGEFQTRVFRHTEIRTLGELVAAVGTYSRVITAPADQRAAAVRATERLLHNRLAAVGPADPARPDTIAVPVAVTVVRGRRRARA